MKSHICWKEGKQREVQLLDIAVELQAKIQGIQYFVLCVCVGLCGSVLHEILN